ncbi:MAG: hypothetical protein AB7S38_18300 [Vulcanimicrobiota bacterium]
MRKLLCFIALLFVATAAADEWRPADKFTWPTATARIVLRGRDITCVWRNGRPFARREEIAGALKLPAEGAPYVDLVAITTQLGYRVRHLDGGGVEVSAPVAGPAAVNSSEARARNEQFLQDEAARQKALREYLATLPVLEASAAKFVAETGFVRAYVRITNVGAGTSPATAARALFTDYMEKPFAQDDKAVPPLAPGQSVDLEFFSMVRDDQMTAGGVIRGAGSDRVRVIIAQPWLPSK